MNLTYFSPKIEKRSSEIEGRGLHARERIRKGEVVVVKGGYVMTHAQRDKVGKILGPSEIQISEELFIGPVTMAEREGGMMHLNHSCEPNVGHDGQIVYVAIRDISPGEEIVVDYAMTCDEDWSMECSCGTPSCRGKITGRDWKIPELQRKYIGYFSPFIQRRIVTSVFPLDPTIWELNRTSGFKTAS